jgi:hypothetical protein
MKVIFLDIDGVLNSTRTPNPRNFPYIVDPKLLRRFKRVLARTRAKVVLSSTWRYDPAGRFSAKHWGIPFIDFTPDMPKKPRRNEIVAWLRDHPDVDRFAVIDDEDDGLDELPLFQPAASTGLTDRIATGVVNYLNRKTDQDMRSNALGRALEHIHAALNRHAG